MAGQDVAGDVDRQGDRAPGHVRALDGAAVEVPRQDRVAGASVGVLADPTGAEDVAGADLQQTAFDVVRHGIGLRSFDALLWQLVGRSTDIGRPTESTPGQSLVKPRAVADRGGW